MLLTRKYKHWLAALLLLLYAFIATPVQWWHHHHTYTQSNNSKVANEVKHSVVLSASASAADENCPICSHKYTAYNYTSLSVEHFMAHSYVAYVLPYQQQIISRVLISLSNRGPPALI